MANHGLGTHISALACAQTHARARSPKSNYEIEVYRDMHKINIYNNELCLRICINSELLAIQIIS